MVENPNPNPNPRSSRKTYEREQEREHEYRMHDETRQHFHNAKEEWRKSMEGMFPPGYWEHRRNARKEMLLAWRSMLDRAIAHIDEKNREESR
jgi:hypothetical protein